MKGRPIKRVGVVTLSKIPIMEIFGPTIQGEGMVIGQKTMFVRTAGCDYQCAWCDSAFTWNGLESDRVRQMEPAEIVDELLHLGNDKFNHVTITGGNPALIGEPMAKLIQLCHERGYEVALETQGSRMQEWFYEVNQLTLSPKPPSSKMKTDFAVLDSIIHRLKKRCVNFSLKIPVLDEMDLDYAREVFARYPDVRQKFLQPVNHRTDEAGDISGYLLDRLLWLFNVVIQDAMFNDVRVLPQLHAIVWSNERER